MTRFVAATALALILAAPAMGREPPAPGTVTTATAEANARVAQALPLNEATDFADATRGRLAQIQGGIIRNAKGDVV